MAFWMEAREGRDGRDLLARGRVLLGDGRLLQWAIAIIVLALVGTALVPAALQVFLEKPLYYPDNSFTLDNIVRLITDPGVRRTLGATLYFSAIVVVLSMLFGVGFAILLGRTDLPAKRALASLLLWPLFLSPQVIGFGAILAFGPSGLVTLTVEDWLGVTPWNLYTVTGIAVVSALANVPVTTLYCLAAARQQDPNHEAAARTIGSTPLRSLLTITLPMMRPALLFALIMNLVHALETLSIPLIIGGPVGIDLLTTLIYKKAVEASGIPDYGLTAGLAFALMLLVAVLFALQKLALRKSYRFISIGGRASAPRLLPLGRWRWPVFVLVAAYTFVVVFLLIGAVAARSFTFLLSPDVPILDVVTLQNYRDVLTEPVYVRSIWNTLILAVVGAALGTALIAAVALVAERSTFPLRRIVDAVAQMPRVIPGLIVGLGVFYASVYLPGVQLLRNTIWLLLIAYLIRFMSMGYGVISPALAQITPDFDRAARVAGAGWPRIMWLVVLPLQKHALLSCFVLLMVLIIKEYTSAVFLMAPGSEVIGSTMLSLWVQGQAGPVAALALIQIGLTAILITVASTLFKVKLHG